MASYMGQGRMVRRLPGQNLLDVDLEKRKDIFPRIVNVIVYLGQIKGLTSSPLTDFQWVSYIYEDYSARTTLSLWKIWIYISAASSSSIDLISHHTLVIPIMAISAEDIILDKDGPICFLNILDPVPSFSKWPLLYVHGMIPSKSLPCRKVRVKWTWRTKSDGTYSFFLVYAMQI